MKALTEEQKIAARIRSREWAQRNKDKVRERSRLRAKTPEVQAYQKAYRDARRVERREYNRKWRAAHPEKARGYAAAYRARDPERSNGHSRRWQRRATGVPEATRPCPAHCELCDRVLEKGKVHLDHCHSTGKFRGWLCNRCNLGLGNLGDNLASLQRAVEYLIRCG